MICFWQTNIQHIPKTIMLYHLELNCNSVPNKKLVSYTHTKFHVFIEIRKDFISENTKIAFLTFLSVSNLKIPKVCLFKMKSEQLNQMFNIILLLNRQQKFDNWCAMSKFITREITKMSVFWWFLVKTTQKQAPMMHSHAFLQCATQF